MTTVAELAQRDHVEIAYLFVAQGVPFMFTDCPDLVGEGALGGVWISSASGSRRVVEGLDMRGTTITYATETGDGRPDTDDGLTFKVTDFARELIAFYAEPTGTEMIPVGDRLGPKDDPAPGSLIATDGASVAIQDQWVNSEAIGPDGQRNWFSIFPTGDSFGQDHAAYSGVTKSLAPSYVYSRPVHLEGRRCALYRIFKDLDTGTYPSWEAQYDSGESLIWVGSLTNDITVEDITWTIKCEGPSSWLRKPLGAQRSTEWLPLSGDLTLSSTPGAREDLFALSFFYQTASTGDIEMGGSSNFTASDVLSTTGTAASFRATINTRIATVSGTAAIITWTTNRNAEASLETLGATTRIDDSSPNKAAIWTLTLHDRIWRALGFDPLAQAATNYDTAYEVKFVPGAQSGLPGVPGPGYYQATFWTVAVGYPSVHASNFACDNGGAMRSHLAIAPPDLVQIPPAGNVELSFGIGGPGYYEGQTNRAPSEHSLSNSGGACDTQGFVAFRGPYQAGPDAEVVTMVQLAQVCWHGDSLTQGGDTIGVDSLGHARVYVSALIDGRFHGIDRTPLDRVWSTKGLEWCPVNFFGYAFQSGDYAHRMLLRLFLSTGTATWSGYDGAATLTAGYNHPAALDGLEPYSDAEIADLGLAIPNALIDIPSFGKAAGALPGGITSPLNRCRYAWVGAQDSQELIAGMLDCRGWGLGFNQGQWRLFSRPDVLTAGDTEVLITPADIAGEPSFVETANLRPFSPRERWKVDFSKALIAEAATDDRELTLEARALDPSSRSRRDNGVADVDGFGLIPTPLWRGEGAPDDWAADWRALFSETMAAWYNAAHVMITGLPVLPSIARQLGPGSVVRLTSYYAPTREGTYGPAAKLGRVYKVEHDLDTREAKIDVLLQPGDALTARYFAPIAVLLDDVTTVEARFDVGTRTFYCYQNAFGHDDTSLSDVTRFAEPAWLGIGGDAKVQGWQWNGRAMVQTFGFTVQSVSSVNNSITYQAGSLTGTFIESQFTILIMAPYDSQPVGSWTKSLFSVLTRYDFKFGAGPTAGFPLA